MGFDPFKGESGLIDNADVTITDAIFTRRPDSFDAGETLELHLTMLIDGDDGGEQVQYLRCGKGWDTTDGVTAFREDGKDKNFHVNSRVWELFGGLVKVMGDDPACDKALRARAADHPLGPRDAGFWKGLKVHVDRETRKGGGDISDYDVLVVTGFNGTAGGKSGKAAGATKKAAAKKADTPAEGGGLTDTIRAKLDEIADASADHDGFMEAAFAGVAEASTDADVKAAIADQGEGSIWADAVARYEALAASDA